MFLLQCDLKIYNIFWIYKIIFILTQFGLDDTLTELSSVGGLQEVTSLSRCDLYGLITLVI